jgi:HAD superfamily hydrolase (TIGR01509 family)
MRLNVTTRHAAVLDVDGTLVDTNYHHALAWYRAFREHEVVVPIWVLHRHIGMGGDKFVAAVAGDDVEERIGDEVRARWEQLFDDLLPEIEPTEGARDLVEKLATRGNRVVFASSAIKPHFDAFIDGVLRVREHAAGWVTKDDVDASKPDPDLVSVALEKLGTHDAVMVGDTPWDCEAARKAGIATIGLLTGGYSREELADAGARAVYRSPRELSERLAETDLA